MKHPLIIFKASILTIFISIILFLLLNIADKAEYSSITGKYLANCDPDDAGIYETDIYHHVLERCSRYYDINYIDINKSIMRLGDKVKVSINSFGFRNKEYNGTRPSDWKVVSSYLPEIASFDFLRGIKP